MGKKVEGFKMHLLVVSVGARVDGRGVAGDGQWRRPWKLGAAALRQGRGGVAGLYTFVGR